MFRVYVIENKEKSLYIGYTNNLERRLDEHNDKIRKAWTASRGPWTLIFDQMCPTRSEAIKLERYLKSFKNKERVYKYIAEWRSSISRGS